MLIGITGGIGAGKSVVSRILRLKGFRVYDCDSRAKWLMENAPEISGALIERYGEDVISLETGLNRAMLAEKVFAIEEERLWLNKLVHGVVRTDLKVWHEISAEEICFVESAIMVSSGLDRMCQRIWLVDAPLELRKERAMSRGGVSEENLELRIRSQRFEFDLLPPEKVERIENGGKSSLLTQIERLLEKNY